MAFCFYNEDECHSIFICLFFMKKILLINCFLLLSCPLFAQKKAKAYKDGEWLKYKMSYSGFFKAGTAELSLKETELEGKKVFHANGFGKTSDFIGWFFKVSDTYESYFSKMLEFQDSNSH